MKEYIITQEQIQKIADFVGANISQRSINESWTFLEFLKSLPLVEKEKENKKQPKN